MSTTVSGFKLWLSFYLALGILSSMMSCKSTLISESGDANQIAQIRGNVIAATNTIFTSSDKYLNSPTGIIYWIINISVNSHRYNSPVTNSGPWRIRVNSKEYDQFGPARFFIPMEVSQGKTGTTTIIFAVPDTSSIRNAKLLYIGQLPQSSGSLSGGKRVDAYDWNLQTAIVKAKTTDASSGMRLSGTYVATLLGVEQTATFKGDTLEMFDKFGGKRIFKYSISPDGTTITTTDIVNGKIGNESFKFIKENGVVVINNISYYRKRGF